MSDNEEMVTIPLKEYKELLMNRMQKTTEPMSKSWSWAWSGSGSWSLSRYWYRFVSRSGSWSRTWSRSGR
jgi:hypothetical protein